MTYLNIGAVHYDVRREEQEKFYSTKYSSTVQSVLLLTEILKMFSIKTIFQQNIFSSSVAVNILSNSDGDFLPFLRFGVVWNGE